MQPQYAITNDNVYLEIDGVLFARIVDAYKASYGVDDAENGILQLSMTNIRAEVGKITLDRLFQERQTVSKYIVDQINNASITWGVECLRYEIKNVKVPDKIRTAMQQQVEAERQKRAKILLSEAEKTSLINIATGEREAKILESEAQKTKQINEAEGLAKATILKAESQAIGLQKIGDKLSSLDNRQAAQITLSNHYLEAFKNMAQKCNSIIMSNDISDGSKMISQGLALYKNLLGNNDVHSAAPTANIDNTQIGEDKPVASKVNVTKQGIDRIQSNSQKAINSKK